MRELLAAGPDFRLADVDPESTPGFGSGRSSGEKHRARGADEIATLQELLFANAKFGDARRVLLVLQAMDTAGKGGIVRHVVGAVNPLGVAIAAFAAPTEDERAHDFLWRVRQRLPKAGELGVFDRSHYEDVLIHRVRSLSPADEIEQRYGQIVDFERELAEEGTQIVKVMLHVSPEEQKVRLGERLDRVDKHWKFSPGDIAERLRWADYMEAYEIAIRRTSTEQAPWYVVPANKKWYARLAVQELLLEALRDLGQDWPEVEFDVDAERRRLAAS